MRVVFLVGRDVRETRAPVEAVCSLPGVIPCGILLDREERSQRQKFRTLRREIRRNGWRYIPFVSLRALRTVTDRMVEKSVRARPELRELLRESLPERNFTLRDIAERYGTVVHEVDNLNSAQAAETLRACRAELGIVLGTRILKPAIFGVPERGSINLHKGKVPEYRGIPPGIWELYDGARVAGVTVHFIDSRIDTGDVLETGEVDISSSETPESLAEKLHCEGIRVLVKAVQSMVEGTAVAKPQTQLEIPPRTIPTLREMATLRRRLPHWTQHGLLRAIAENLLYLGFFRFGFFRRSLRDEESGKPEAAK